MRQAGRPRVHRDASESRLFENAAVGVAYLDAAGLSIRFNQRLSRSVGYASGQVPEAPFIELLPPRDAATTQANLKRLWRGAIESYGIETQLRGRTGDYFWVDITFAVETDESGAPAAIVAIVQDADARKAAEERQRLLVAEINHRVRNTLATVQAIAMQTWRHTEDPRRFIESFSARLSSLAAAHDVLMNTAWQGADLGDLIDSQLTHAGVEARRVRRSGPAVFLPPRVALHLSLILHELATNALRHGALLTERGSVEVTWRLSGGAETDLGLALSWIESGGPRANAPKRLGLGTLLIERAAFQGLDARITLSWRTSGLDVAINVPIPRDARRSELFRP